MGSGRVWPAQAHPPWDEHIPFDSWRQSLRPSDVFLPWVELDTLVTREPRRDAKIMGMETCGWWGGTEPANARLAVDRLDIYESWASSPVRAPTRSLAVVRSGWPWPALSCAGEWTLAQHPRHNRISLELGCGLLGSARDSGRQNDGRPLAAENAATSASAPSAMIPSALAVDTSRGSHFGARTRCHTPTPYGGAW
jgi:hypothetical protein